MMTRREALLSAFIAAVAVAIPKPKPPVVRLPEFSISSDMSLYSGDILEEKYRYGLEQIMKAEDEVWLRHARECA